MPETIEQTVVYKLRRDMIRRRIEMLERDRQTLAAKKQEAGPFGHFAGYIQGAELYNECEVSFLKTLLD